MTTLNPDMQALSTPDFDVDLVAPRATWPNETLSRATRFLTEHDDPETVDLVTNPQPGLITKRTVVSTVGSCFAGNIKRWLLQERYNVLIAERGPGAAPGSARFGRVYSTACLRQLFEAPYGLFDPIEKHWRVGDQLIDPYRQLVGWPDERSAANERAAHHASVRRIVDESEVMICTIGLAETWRDRRDGATFFTVPPNAHAHPDRYECVMTTVDENVENLDRLYALLRAHNPGIRLVITASPVPLAATFREPHAVLADTVSKATVRLAVYHFCERHPEVVYFPAFEYVRALSKWPWEADNRHVSKAVVDRIMSNFMRHYGEPQAGTAAA